MLHNYLSALVVNDEAQDAFVKLRWGYNRDKPRMAMAMAGLTPIFYHQI
jgi:hypothetical protein